MILRKKIYCKSTKNEWKGSHNKFVCLSFVGFLTTVDVGQYFMTLKSFHNLQNQWLVVSTFCQEMKNHLTRKVGFEGTPKLGPHWKLQPVAYKVNME